MRTLNLIIVVLALTVSTSVFASGNAQTSKKQAKETKEIVRSIQKQFATKDFQDKIDGKLYNNVFVYFKVNEKKQVEPYLVLGANKTLNTYVENELVANPIVLSEMPSVQNYKIKLEFK